MSLTKATYSMIEGAPANVLDFGADPTGTSDSTAAFNAALIAATKVYVPKGLYNVTSITVPVNKATILYGDGDRADGSIIQGTQAGATILSYQDDSGVFKNRHSQIKDLQISGTTNTINIKVNNLGVNMTNVTSQNGLIGVEANRMVGSVWTRVTANGSSIGMKFIKLPAGSERVIWANVFNMCSVFTNQASGTFGLYVEDPDNAAFLRNNTFIDFVSEFTGTGVKFVGDTSRNCVFINLWVEKVVDYYIDESAQTANKYINYFFTSPAPGASPGTDFSANSVFSAGWDGFDQKTSTNGGLRFDFGTRMFYVGPTHFYNTGTISGVISESPAGTFEIRSQDTGLTGFEPIKVRGSTVSLQSNTNSGIVFTAYNAAGTLSVNGSGVVTSSSDERLKDISGDFNRGLSDILKIEPKNFRWKEDTPLADGQNYSGFIAQNVKQAIPEAVYEDKEGFYTMLDRTLIAALVNAVKELKTEIDKLKSNI